MLNGRFGLGFVFSAKDLASAKMRALEQRFQTLDDRVTGGTERMTGAFKQLGIGLAVFTAGAVAVAGAFALAGAAGKFEQGLAAVGAVTRATTDQLRSLRDAAIQAGIQTQFSPDEAVAGLQSLATAGQTAEQATRTLVPVLDLAAGSLGQLGVASAAEAVVGTLNAYGMAAGQAAGVTDKLLRITQLTNFQTRDFEAGLAKAAAAGSVFGQNLDDVLITMGLLRNRNIDASSSATAFREATRRVGASSRAQQAIQGAGVSVFDKATGRMRSMVDIMTDFARATSSMGEAERNRRVVQAFGARGLLAFNAVLNASFTTMRDGRQVTLQGAEAIAALRKEMQGAGGTAAGFREKLLDTFEGQKTLLSGTLQTLAIGLGEPFAQALKPVVGAVTGALNAVIRVVTATRSVADTVSILKRRKLGVHLIVGPDGRVTQHADLANDLLWHARGHNSPSVGIEVVGPFYPSNLREGLPWSRVIDAPWAHRGQYVLPTFEQVEATAKLVRWMTSDEVEGLSIPRTWVGLDAGQLAMGRIEDGQKQRPGVWAHTFWNHSDGAWLVLYSWLRLEAGYAPCRAYEAAVLLAEGARASVDLSNVIHGRVA